MPLQKPVQPDWIVADQFLHSCCRSFYNPTYWDEAIALTKHPDFDWETILRFVNVLADVVTDTGRIAPFMYHILREQSFVPDDILASLRRQYMITANTNQFYFDELGKVLQQLSDEGIDVIVLKGAVLAHTIYDNIGLRPMGDLDLLVQKKDFEKTALALQSLDYQIRDKVPSLEVARSEISLIKETSHLNVPIDLHFHLLHDVLMHKQVSIDWFWQEVEPIMVDGVQTQTLSAEAMLIHLCVHHFSHNVHHGGYDLARWIDIIQFIDVNQTEIDWQKVIEQSKTFDLILGIKTILPSIQQIHPIVPQHILEIVEDLEVSQNEQYRHKMENEGTPHEWRFHVTLNQLKKKSNWGEKARLIVTELLPSKQFMKQAYNIQYSTLLPAYYIYRWYLGAKIVVAGLFDNK